MDMRGVLFFGAGLCMGAPPGVEELMERAMQNNRELAAIRQRLPEARGLLRQAGARPAPTVEFAVTSGRPIGTFGEEQYTAAFNFILETGGKRRQRIEAAESGITVAQAEAEERIRQLRYELSVLYVDAAGERRKIENLDRLIALNRESIRLTDARVREGDAAPLERQLLSVELSRAEADRSARTGRFEAAVLELRQLTGLGEAEPLDLVPPTTVSNPLDTKVLRERARRERPDLKLLRAVEQQSEAETRLALAQGKPDLALTASYSRQQANFDEYPVPLRDLDNVLTAGVQIPLGTRKRNRGNVEAATARAAAARMRREYLEAKVSTEVTAAVRRYDAARAALLIFDDRVLNQSDKNLEIIRQAYQLGQFRLLDVLAEQRRFIENQLSYIDAQTELAKSEADLERAVGGRIQ
jgi:cobalt-zinc-cadmium efflux system outer membrane protein